MYCIEPYHRTIDNTTALFASGEQASQQPLSNPSERIESSLIGDVNHILAFKSLRRCRCYRSRDGELRGRHLNGDLFFRPDAALPK